MQPTIFVINLDRKFDRWIMLQQKLSSIGLNSERIQAVDGQCLSPQIIKQNYSERLNNLSFEKKLNAGEIGCYLSHLACMKEIIRRELDYALVLEDDIEPNENLKFAINAIGSLKGDWDLIKLIDPFKARKFRILESTNGFDLVKFSKVPITTMAQIIKKTGAIKITNQRPPLYRPIDVDLQYYWDFDLCVRGLFPYSFNSLHLESEIEKFGIRRSNRLNLPRRLFAIRRKLAFKLRNFLETKKP